MSSRALRRLREEKEAAALAEEDAGSDEESSEEEEEKGGGGGFMMMLEEESSEEESSSDESEDGDDGGDESDDGKEEKKTAPVVKPKKGKRPPKVEEEEEEDLDAILSDMNIRSTHHSSEASAPEGIATVRALLLSKSRGFDPQDLDLDHAIRSLVGGGDGGGGGHAMGDLDDAMGAPQNQRQRGQPRRGNRGRRTLARKYLFGKPRPEWGKPPSYVGGGLGTKELTGEAVEEERNAWGVPWPYSSRLAPTDRDHKGNDVDDTIIPVEDQRWHTLQMSDTYQEDNYLYQEMLSSQGGPGAMHDPNALAMFVADHPYFAETVLQLAMVLYYVNDRGRGNDLLRRCMFLYESALPSNLLPGNASDGENEGQSSRGEILVDIDRQPNSGLFATLFRIMQTSGMSGCHDNALATGRYLLSLDPLRDPMGVLLILDYYALASRRSSAMLEGDVEAGATFIVDLVESQKIAIHYRDPLTDRHHRCSLEDMPNWAYSYALALYRLSKAEEGYEERAEDSLVRALSKFPMVLPKLLAMNKVNTRDRSFRMDWPAVLPNFEKDANDSLTNSGDTMEDRVSRASGEHLVRIYVQRCHKLWKEEDVLQWVYLCAERAVQEHKEAAKAKKGGGEGEGKKSLTEEAQDGFADSSTSGDGDNENGTPPHMASTFSPALARYAQCDPSEYEDAFRTFPPEAIALDPNIVAPAAVALRPDGAQRRRFFRGRQQRQRGGGGMDEELEGQDPLEVVRRMLGLGGDGAGGGQEVEVLDPDSPLLQLYLQSLLPWAQVEGVRPPPRG